MTDTPNKNYHCYTCDVSFSREAALNNGLYTVHYLEKGNPNSFTAQFIAFGLKCEICHTPLNLNKEITVLSYQEGKEDVTKKEVRPMPKLKRDELPASKVPEVRKASTSYNRAG